MPDLTLAQRFGSNATFSETNKTVTIDLNNFKNSSAGGEILNNLGIDSLTSITAANINTYASKILYALLILNAQKQSTTINDNASEKIYLTEGGIRIATGTRNGQIQRVINVNIFDTSNTVSNLVDIDNV